MQIMFVIICLLFSSCATIINGPDQKITVLSEPSGADITINGEEAGKTPKSFRVVRSKDHLICVSMPGYHTEVTELKRELSKVSLLYLLPGGLISMAIDSTQSAAFCFPDTVDVTLKPLFHKETVLAAHMRLLQHVTATCG